MERTKKEKHKDLKLAIDVTRSLIKILEDATITTLERADWMTTVLLALILKVRRDEKGGVH